MDTDRSTTTIRIFISDDNSVLRDALRIFIEGQPDMQVVGEAANVPEAERGIRQTEPDVVLMDIGIPGGGGLPAIDSVKRAGSKAHFVVLTAQDEAAYVRAAADAGAKGFVVKTAVDVQLLEVIRAVAHGQTVIDASVTPELPLRPSWPFRAAGIGERGPFSTLSDQEREVLSRIAEGYSSGEIAERLKLEASSVEEYKSKGMDKLGLATRSELVRLALDCGVLLPAKPSR